MDENEALEKLSNSLDKMSSELNYALIELMNIYDNLTKINQLTGAAERFENMKLEIKTYGWDYITHKYHPDINVNDPASHELFTMYKFAYDTLKRNNEV